MTFDEALAQLNLHNTNGSCEIDVVEILSAVAEQVNANRKAIAMVVHLIKGDIDDARDLDQQLT